MNYEFALKLLKCNYEKYIIKEEDGMGWLWNSGSYFTTNIYN